MENSYFLWNNNIYQLIDSGPIGLSLMVIIAEAFLQVLESNAINIALSKPLPVAPITHRRYVDDTHDRFTTRANSEEFLIILNSQEPRIQYTPEYEDDHKQLNFLDCTLINKGEGHYETKVFRKDAITNVLIKPLSCHDGTIIYGVFKGFLHRARKICSEQYLKEEIEFITAIFVENGYERNKLEAIINNSGNHRDGISETTNRFISLPFVPGISKQLKKVFSQAGLRVAFKSGRNLQSILSNRNKPKLPPNSCPGCYRIPCLCGGHYIGETKKRANVRFKEHEKAIFKGQKADSALSEHAVDNCSMGIDWENASMISTEPRYFKRCVRESLEIQREKIGHRKDKIINREAGKYVTTTTWLSLFEKINKF